MDSRRTATTNRRSTQQLDRGLVERVLGVARDDERIDVRPPRLMSQLDEHGHVESTPLRRSFS